MCKGPGADTELDTFKGLRCKGDPERKTYLDNY